MKVRNACVFFQKKEIIKKNLAIPISYFYFCFKYFFRIKFNSVLCTDCSGQVKTMSP